MCIYYLTRRIKCLFDGTIKQILLAEVQLAKSPSLLQVSVSGFMTKASLISSYKNYLPKQTPSTTSYKTQFVEGKLWCALQSII